MSVPVTRLVAQVRRNLISILFPSVVAWAIYADWSHTRQYKAEKAKKALTQNAVSVAISVNYNFCFINRPILIV